MHNKGNEFITNMIR